MTWLLTTVLCVFLVEIFVRLPLPAVISRINVIGRKALRTLGAKSVSDHWKEKVLNGESGFMGNGPRRRRGR